MGRIALAEAGFARRSQSAGGAEPFEGSALDQKRPINWSQARFSQEPRRARKPMRW
jgi:hypothetical protein